MPKIEVIDGKTPEELAAEAAALAESGEEEEQEEEEELDPEQPAEGAEAEQEEETIVSIGEESVEEAAERHTPAPQWIKELRQKTRDQARQIRELTERANGAAGVVQKIQVGKKPTLEACDFDAERFERELDTWHDTKRKADQQEAQEKEQADAQGKQWQERMQGYEKSKAILKVIDFEDAESAVQEALTVTQQGIIVSGVDNSALMIYALGKNPAKLKELAAIKDPVKFTFAIAKLEPQLKTTTRNKAPAPERRLDSSGSTSGVVNNELEKLRAEAEKTGDYTKVVAYRKRMKEKARA
jgi:hypothetical protein